MASSSAKKKEEAKKRVDAQTELPPNFFFFFSPRLNVSLGHATHQFTDTTMLFFFKVSRRQQKKLCALTVKVIIILKMSPPLSLHAMHQYVRHPADVRPKEKKKEKNFAFSVQQI